MKEDKKFTKKEKTKKDNLVLKKKQVKQKLNLNKWKHGEENEQRAQFLKEIRTGTKIRNER